VILLVADAPPAVVSPISLAYACKGGLDEIFLHILGYQFERNTWMILSKNPRYMLLKKIVMVAYADLILAGGQCLHP
jgi:hypothetical protein